MWLSWYNPDMSESVASYDFQYGSPFGLITATSDGEHITRLDIIGNKNLHQPAKYLTAKDLDVFASLQEWLTIYFRGEIPPFTPSLAPVGSEFRQAVWRVLLTIPYGETTTYGEIAKIIANQTGKAKMSAQAVGGAVGHNPICIIVPCHRVIGANGGLTGYSGGEGLYHKTKLLAIEGIC